jgi:iron complex transport system substrate-binding protein
VVVFAADPQRIVSTAPSITEMLYGLGLGRRVAGVTTHCRYPADAAAKPKIGDYLSPNLERIIALRPDLVILENSGIRKSGPLPGLNVPVLEVDDTTIAGIYDSVERIGRAAGVPERAAALNSAIRAGLDEVRRRVAVRPRRRVMFLVGNTPGSPIVAGKGSYLDQVLEIAGGDNIFRDSAVAYGKVSLEEVLARNPEVIIDMGEMADTSSVTEEQKRAAVERWQRYPTLAAVRGRRVFAVASDIYVVPGPRVVEAARAFAKIIHPEVF